MENINEFIDYVWSFYNPTDGIYPIIGLTQSDIFEALNVYQERLISNPSLYGSWGYGDSLDRERVRDIILDQPHLKLDPNTAWGM